ncbi:MAG TPA: hypothetical protein VI670_25585 [Thermoanaerobaculia bacterium]
MENFFGQPLFLRIAIPCQPIDDVGQAAHRADFNDLFQAEPSRGNSGVNAVRKPLASLLAGFDDGRGVHARAGAERIAAKDRILVGQRHVRDAGDEANIFAKL